MWNTITAELRFVARYGVIFAGGAAISWAVPGEVDILLLVAALYAYLKVYEEAHPPKPD